MHFLTNCKSLQDLINGKWDDSLFCISLRARDTNNIASVATIMQLVDVDDRCIGGLKTWPGTELPSLNRIVVTCKAVGVADIVSVDNPEVWREGYQGSDYLVAKVQPRTLLQAESNDVETSSLADAIISDYQRIRTIYMSSQSIASNELPPFARTAIEAIPSFENANIVQDESLVWTMIETWQMLCNTIRQAKRSQLQSTVNDLSVEIAMQSSGPLQLPVRRESLPENVQRQLDEMEQSATKDFVESGMDPIVPFQEIITTRNHLERVKMLSVMIKRERSRLEAKESLIQAFLQEELGDLADGIDWSGFN